MDKQWTAAAWMLERRWPGRWGKQPDVVVTQNVEVSNIGPPVPDGGTLLVFGRNLSKLIEGHASKNGVKVREVKDGEGE